MGPLRLGTTTERADPWFDRRFVAISKTKLAKHVEDTLTSFLPAQAFFARRKVTRRRASWFCWGDGLHMSRFIDLDQGDLTLASD